MLKRKFVSPEARARALEILAQLEAAVERPLRDNVRDAGEKVVVDMSFLSDEFNEYDAIPAMVLFHASGKLFVVSLPRCELTSLEFLAPYDLSELVGLEVVNNRLATLPDFLARCVRIETLSLDGNQFRALPPVLEYLHSLKGGRFSGNPLARLPDVFWHWSQLETLSITKTHLEALPPSFQALTSLRRCDLSHNRLRELPPWIGKLERLESLDVSGNALAHLPAELGHLTNLKRLYASENALTKLPSTMGDLTQLEFLSLPGNKLERLPDSLTRLGKLSYLSLFENLLEALPDRIGDLASLEDLSAGDNRLHELPVSFGNLPVKKLFLEHNPLARLPPTFGNLTRLEFLQLSGTCLHSFQALAGLERLETLRLDECGLERVPGDLRDAFSLPSLDEVSLERNRFTEFPRELLPVLRLKGQNIFEFSGNPFPPAVWEFLHAIHMVWDAPRDEGAWVHGCGEALEEFCARDFALLVEYLEWGDGYLPHLLEKIRAGHPVEPLDRLHPALREHPEDIRRACQAHPTATAREILTVLDQKDVGSD